MDRQKKAAQGWEPTAASNLNYGDNYTTNGPDYTKSLDELEDELLDDLAADSRAEWEIELERHIEKWNKTHASVIVGGKHKIMRLIPAEASPMRRDSYEFISRHELNLVYANKLIKVGEKQLGKNIKDVLKTHLMAWAEDSRSRSYTGGVVFLPGKKPPKDYFNTWQGFAVEPVQNDALLTRIFSHMKTVICGGNTELYDYLIKWIAFTIQNPDKPAGAAVVLRGNKGSGKSTLGRLMCNIWGNHSFHIHSSKHLTGDFNGHLNDVCFLFSDEAFYSGDKAGENRLKGLVTDPEVTIERKGIDAVRQPNYLKILMATNSDYAVPASRDERRYCVFDVADTHIGDRAYFDALSCDVADKAVQAAFLAYMLDIDLSGWHWGDIPETAGLRAQRFHSMDSVQKWVAQSLNEGSFGYVFDEVLGRPVDGYGWVGKLNTSELYAKYEAYCDSAKHDQYHRVGMDQMASYLGKIFKRKNHVNGRDRRGFIFGELEAAKAAFEQYEKISLSELWSV
jgi:hypothetical protein